jgi:hypothetical protein
MVIWILRNPNTIRTFSTQFAQKALSLGFQTNAEGSLVPRRRHTRCWLKNPAAETILEKTGSPKADSKRTRGLNDIEADSSHSPVLVTTALPRLLAVRWNIGACRKCLKCAVKQEKALQLLNTTT